MDMAQRDRTHSIAIFYYNLEHENPTLAAMQAKDSAWYHSVVDHTIPGDIHVPQNYVDKLYPAWNRICELEISNANYSALSTELKAEYDRLWAEIYPLLPAFVQEAVDAGEYQDESWNTISAEGLEQGYAKAIAREEKQKATRS